MNKIILGASGLFKREKALAEARVLLSTESLESHPDFLIVEPKEKKISVDETKKIVEFLAYNSQKVAKKVVVIDKCHLGTAEFQQSLLKLLEDGGEKAHFVLTTESPLLDTIHSRCSLTTVKKWSDAEVTSWIEEKGLVVNPVALALADGRPGIYRNLLEEEGLLKAALNLKKNLIECPAKAVIELGALRDGFEPTKEQQALLIGFIERTLFDRLSCEGGPVEQTLDAIDLCIAERERVKMRSYGKTETFKFYRSLHSVLRGGEIKN